LSIAAVVVSGAQADAQRKAAPVKPRIVLKPIPFSPARRAETAAYAERHYGIDSWRLLSPHVVVQHYTDSTTMLSAWSTFAADVPDGELHELPGICAHFIIDTDGTIYQLVPLTVMCRHTVGLNYTAIGIEHVGTTAGQVLGDARQMASSLQLTAWLMARFHIAIGDVIGHNESLESPYRRESYPAWKCQTHADFPRAAMDIYRSRLASVARSEGVTLGRRVHRVPSRCR
jgi:N-acetylmuramoyl-L-alanine amidase